MGEPSRTFSLKSSRKQPNPRFFRVSSPNTELPSSSNDSMREKETNTNNNNNNGEKQKEEEEEEEGEEEGDDKNVDLKAYTRSEVTIIDTSFEIWKCDKWVFRKNDEWKIKDKKSCKSRFCGAKKKKVLVSKLGDCININNNVKLIDDDGDKLMMKMKMKKKGKREVDNLLMHQLNKEPPQNDKEREPFKERDGFLSKVPRKRFPCPRPPKKVRNESSPVVLLKSIPPSNVNTTIKPGNIFHKKRPKQMKIS